MTTSSISTNTSSTNTRLAALILAAGLLLGAGEAGPEQVAGARALVDETVQQVMAVLKNPNTDLAAKRRELEGVAHARFDFEVMSRLVLRKHWRALSDAKQAEFVEAFTTYLANDYGRRLGDYNDEEVRVISAEPAGTRGDVLVRTEIVSNGATNGAVVDYRMKHGDGKWRIINVVVEGISLVHNFADQFSEVISRGGAEALLRKLREKNAANEAPSGA